MKKLLTVVLIQFSQVGPSRRWIQPLNWKIEVAIVVVSYQFSFCPCFGRENNYKKKKKKRGEIYMLAYKFEK